MANKRMFKYEEGKNTTGIIRIGGDAIMFPTWNTRTGKVEEHNDVIERMAAALNFLDGISLDVINAGITLKTIMKDGMERIDQSDDIYDWRGMFPSIWFELAGGEKNVKLWSSTAQEDAEDALLYAAFEAKRFMKTGSDEAFESWIGNLTKEEVEAIVNRGDPQADIETKSGEDNHADPQG